MTFEEAKQQAIERSEWVLCHGAGYYTARTPDGRNIIGKGENGVFVGGEYRRVVPTGGFCYKFQPDLGSWTCVDSHRITFMRHNKIEKRFERLRVKDVDDKYTRYINRDRTKSGEYLPLKLNRLNMINSESWEHSEIEEAAVEAFLKDNGDSYIMEEMIIAANYLMP